MYLVVVCVQRLEGKQLWVRMEENQAAMRMSTAAIAVRGDSQHSFCTEGSQSLSSGM